ncbi:3-hydroxyacyl-CoA dehydrogenase family protein [Brevibacillus daliensis]|uniref:3-hydroxyacyl-CoA dehydrogenase family protein n=1 Tax=Brevibacillus daliensis TaxID=2892995 RepID=UPI001E31F7EC|nr:3-hydroxyacyl-CoA dehydrogenase family protein [Brevibacillus daliensis]
MTTANQTILLVGEGPLFEELHYLMTSNQYQVIDLKMAETGTYQVKLALEVMNTDLEKKKDSIVQLDRLLSLEVPIVTTSLAITATEVASWTKHPERICGFGTLVPLVERELIEIAPALQTAEEITPQVTTFFTTLGKETEVVVDEVGLVFPRILSLIINEAVFAVMEKTATAEDIDIAMQKGTNYPQGPLAWADQIGIDEIYAIVNGIHRDLREERYRPAPLLRKLVLAARTGKKCGQGFYLYPQEEGIRV